MNEIQLSQKDRKLAILIDPDKHDAHSLLDTLNDLKTIQPDFLMIGGSLIYKIDIDETCKMIKSALQTPLILFPGHATQITNEVDGVLVLSLISGRNPDLLIGQHVIAAPRLKAMDAQKISTGYILVDGGNPTSVSYMSNTAPIPRTKNDIAICTAQAGELLGMQWIYMDAGSGAKQAVPSEMVQSVANAIDIPLVVGGGLRTLAAIEELWQSGANLVVIGNALESDNNTLAESLSLRTRSQQH